MESSVLEIKQHLRKKVVFVANTHLLLSWSLFPKMTVGQKFVQPCIVNHSTQTLEMMDSTGAGGGGAVL